MLGRTAINVDQAVNMLIELLRAIGQSSFGSIRKPFKFKTDGYVFKYKPFWDSSEYVPSNRATYLVYRYQKGWWNKKLGEVTYDDGAFMGQQVQNELEVDIKDELAFIEACNYLESKVTVSDEPVEQVAEATITTEEHPREERNRFDTIDPLP